MTTLNTRNLLIAAAILFGFSSTTQAREISGSLDFTAVGEIINEIGGDAAAYNSLDSSAGGNEASCVVLNCTPSVNNASGEILNMILADPGAPTLIMPDDFSFVPSASLEAHTLGTVSYKIVPSASEAIEWILGPVTDDINGATGTLEFIITSGAAADVSSNGSLDDLAGTGFFRFVEDAGSVASTYIDGVAGGLVSQGHWTLSNSGGLSITGFNVPTPAALGLFGLGLLGLGMIRRRRETV